MGERQEANPQCSIQAEAEGYQMAVLWHVDDLKILFKDDVTITKLLVYLNGIYGDSIVVHRGQKHDYLGMDLDFYQKMESTNAP